MQTLKAQIIDWMTINKFAFGFFCLYCDMDKKQNFWIHSKYKLVHFV